MTSDTTTPEGPRAQLERMRDRTNTFAGNQNMVSKAQYADDVSLLLDALEAAIRGLGEVRRSSWTRQDAWDTAEEALADVVATLGTEDADDHE